MTIWSIRSSPARARRYALACLLAIAVVQLSGPGTATAETTFRFSGRGWGHRVGMSQWGARGLAEAGRGHGDILRFYYTGTTIESRSMPSHVRVGLLWERTDPIEFKGDKDMELVAGDDRRTVPANQQWSVSATSDGRFRIRDGSNAEVAVVGGTGEHLVLSFGQAGARLELPDTGHRYRRGHLEFNVYSNGSGGYWIRVIAVVPSMDEYLYGLAEMPSSWHSEALKAQAVAGRTYALDKIQRSGQHRGVCNCALFATTFDQVYAGDSKESGASGDRWVKAVNDTSGQVVLHSGSPITAFYSSSSGGSTEANEDVFSGSPLPYLRPVFDPWSNHPSNANRLWQASFTASELAAKFGMDAVYAVDLSERSAGGGVRRARIAGRDDGQDTTLTISGSTLRSTLGLRSAMVNVHQWSEFVLLMNPNDATANVDLTLMFPDRSPTTHSTSIPARSRKTVSVDQLSSSGDVSVKVAADRPIAAERAMYFFTHGVDGGHDAAGSPAPAHAWYFAEGATHSGFSEFLLVNNPSTSQNAVVTVTLFKASGGTMSPPGLQGVTVGPGKRLTVAVNSIAPGADVSARITSEGAPVVAERAMYFAQSDAAGYPTVDDGTASAGLTGTAERWHLAEGATHSGFSTFVLVLNPNPDPVSVALDLLSQGGVLKTEKRTVPGFSRTTFALNAIVPGKDVSTIVRSETPGKGVVAERAMYFRNGLLDGGTGAAAAAAGSERWFLPEGATHSGFSTFVLVMNPHDQTVRVALDLLSQGGVAKTVEQDLPPRSRATFALNALLPGKDVSTVVRSLTGGRGVIAERAMYFQGNGIDGGHASLGVPATSTTWYFAEGFTG